MCRKREEIIATDTTLQDLQLFIKQYEAELLKGDNGKIHFELAQARAALDTRISQIQTNEDVMERFELASEARNDVKTELTEKLSICEDNICSIANKLDAHITDYKAFPPLKKEISISPIKTLGGLLGLIISLYTILFFLSHTILYATGFDVMFLAWVKNLFGL